MKKTIVAWAVSCLSSMSFAQAPLTVLTDEQLSAVQGGTLLNMEYTAPNSAASATPNENIGFYKLAVNAEMEMNLNIAKLQLGCGGINGSGCDIDIDHLSLSGQSNTSDGRAASSALINNPFIQFAIKNPTSASAREVVGFRISAENVKGLLTTGLENSAKANGINSFSGYMQIQSGVGTSAAERSKLKGYATTQSAYMNLKDNPIEGDMVAIGVATVGFKTNGGGFNIPSMNNLPFETDAIVVNGNRQKSAKLTATVNIPTIHLGSDSNYPTEGRVTFNSNDPYQTSTAVYTAGHPVNAEITSCSSPITLGIACLVAPKGRQFNSIQMQGKVEGAQAQVNFEEALGFVHNIELNSAFSLSLQKDAIRWPGAALANIAQPGWWLAVADPISIGEVMPEERLTIQPLLGQFAAQASLALKDNPAKTNDIGGILSGTNLDANIGTIVPKDKLTMNLKDLQLKGQNFASNCFGGHKFC